MVDIAGTKQKVQRMVKVAEETYKKINEVIEKVDTLQKDLATTSEQVDYMEAELAEQRALLEALAREQGVDVEEILEGVEYPDRLADADEETGADEGSLSDMATSRPSAAENQE